MFHQLVAFLLPIVTQVLVASCKATIAIAFVLLCRWLLRERLPAAVRHLLWLAVLVCLLLPVGFELRVMPALVLAPPAHSHIAAEIAAPSGLLPTSRASQPLALRPAISPLASHPLADEADGTIPDDDLPALVIPVPEVVRPTDAGMTLREWLALLWGAIVTGLFAVPLCNLLRYRRIVARATPPAGPAQDLLLQCAEQAGLRRKLRLLESPEVPAPAVLGWWSPVLLLPARLHERLEPAQLRHVYLHELAHVRRHDILANWLATAAQVLHWFNPVAWHGLRVMRSDMEQACDAEVLRRLAPDEHAGYGQTLIGILDACPGRLPAHGLGVVESHAQLKERITAIARFGSRRAAPPVLAPLLVLAVTSVAAMQPRAVPQPGPSEAEPAAVPEPATAPEPASFAPASGVAVTSSSPSAAAARFATTAATVAVAAPPSTSAAATAPAAAAASAPPSVPQSAVSTPAAAEAASFTVRLQLNQFGPDMNYGTFPQEYVQALAARLRAIPGLVLVTPESGVPLNEPDYDIVVLIFGMAPDGKPRVTVVPRTLAAGNSGRALLRKELIASGRHAIAYEVRQDEPGFGLDRDIDRLRITVFPPDPSVSRELRAKLLDPRESFARRFGTLNLLLDFDLAPGTAVPDPEVIRLGARVAATLPDPKQRGVVWSRLGETGSAELPALLAQALEAESDADTRLAMLVGVAATYAAHAPVRAVLEMIARNDPREITRRAARRLLAGEGRWDELLWKDYVLATLVNTDLSEEQRIDPLAYPWIAGLPPRQQFPLDEAASRALASLLRKADAYTHAVMGAAYVLGRARGPAAQEAIVDVIRVVPGGTPVLRDVREQILLALSGATVRSDARMHAAVMEVAARDPDAGVRLNAWKVLQDETH